MRTISTLAIALVIWLQTAVYAGEKIEAPAYYEQDSWTWILKRVGARTSRSDFGDGEYTYTFVAGKLQGESNTFLETIPTITAENTREWFRFPIVPGPEIAWKKENEPEGKLTWKGSYVSTTGRKSQTRTLQTWVGAVKTINGYDDAVEHRQIETRPGGDYKIYTYYYSQKAKGTVQAIIKTYNREGDVTQEYESRLSKFSLVPRVTFTK